MKLITLVVLVLCLAGCVATVPVKSQGDVGIRTKDLSPKIDNVANKASPSANTAVLTEDGKILLVRQEPSILLPVNARPVPFLYGKEESPQ